MNSKQLLYFLKTAELCSIAAAARELEIAQPSISLQLENLEHELGTSLFDRDYRGVRLTESGQLFKAHAESIMRQVDQAKLDIRQSEQEPAGRLVLGMTQPIGNVVSVPLLKLVEQRYPKIELDLFAGLSYSLSAQLLNGEIDLAISSPDGSDMKQLTQEHLFRENLYLAMGDTPQVSSQKPLRQRESISFAELAKHEVIVTGRQDSLGYVLRQYEQRHGINVRHKPGFGQLMTTLRYVSDGYGMLLSPSSSFYHLEETGQVHALEIVDPCMKRDVYITRAANRPRTSLMRAVIPLIYEVVQQEQQAGHWRGEFFAPEI
ncbi:LysR family transcriptional regulator [Amphritea sp. 2_MG-2023]|uniref:LysR family transcriptional regulator n=1 Tax=Amphritea TaxID=515417 RepID=UPI001C06AB25|nr:MULTISPECIES: LysR family transcriptional regulator [Amphritea]MBU2966146.1 LysR family transcriptional regulator [Amphritea atlantica]MDO6418199.1 LysR family transcriptional regulator [Amphritea sp. 2_MG-2023]